MTDLTRLSLADARKGLVAKSFTATELTGAYLSAIEKANPSLNAYVAVTGEQALDMARASDEKLAQGQGGALEGIPISVKDNYCTQGIASTAGSKILRGFVPEYESHVSGLAKTAGATFLGKSNMDEFGMGSATENSCYGPTRNPWGEALGLPPTAPGGSSGGAAASVAAGLAIAGLATDTGGSIRQPAAFCGVTGMKPTYGMCSRRGIMAYGSSLDQAGVIARSVEDVSIVMDAVMGFDPLDSTSANRPPAGLEAALSSRGAAMTVGFPRSFVEGSGSDLLDNLWKVAREKIEAAGHRVVLVDLPNIEMALPCYYVLALSEASSNLARYDGVRYGFRARETADIVSMYEQTRGAGFNYETKKRILMGTFALSSGYYDQYFNKARKVRTLIKSGFDQAFETVDVLAWPTAPTEAFQLGSHNTDPLSMYLEDVFTVPVNLAGLPALSLPIAKGPNGLPLGFQFVGPQFGDATVVRISHQVEQLERFDLPRGRPD